MPALRSSALSFPRPVGPGSRLQGSNRFGPVVEPHVFIARQPILDRARRVVAYELLFRPSEGAGATGPLPEQATASVLTDAVMAFGLDTLTLGRPAFINATRFLLLEGLHGLEEILPPDRVVIEVLEDIEADAEVIEACAKLKQSGYAIALDDFVLSERNAGLVPLADYIKIDLLAGPPADPRGPIGRLRDGTLPTFVAEKVETIGQYEQAAAVGFDCFQGYFFGRPSTQTARRLPGHRLSRLQLLHVLQDPDLDAIRLEALIQQDAGLCYRLLRTANSAGFGQTRPLSSIRQAIVLIGVGVVRRWVMLWLLAGLGESAHPELLAMSAVRARCCELLAGHVPGASPDEGFLLGMCSLLDAILNQPMSVVVEELPLPAAMRAALVGEDNFERRLLECALALDRGEWSLTRRLALLTGIGPDAQAAAYRAALRWFAELSRTAA